MILDFSAEIIFWKGPAPFYFVTVPPDESELIAENAPLLTYGWGVIPVTVDVGKTQWTTSLFPKEGAYLVPLKVAIREAEGLELGETIEVRLTFDV